MIGTETHRACHLAGAHLFVAYHIDRPGIIYHLAEQHQ